MVPPGKVVGIIRGGGGGRNCLIVPRTKGGYENTCPQAGCWLYMRNNEGKRLLK